MTANSGYRSNSTVIYWPTTTGTRSSRASCRWLWSYRWRREVLDCEEQLGQHLGTRAWIRQFHPWHQCVRHWRRAHWIAGMRTTNRMDSKRHFKLFLIILLFWIDLHIFNKKQRDKQIWSCKEWFEKFVSLLMAPWCAFRCCWEEIDQLGNFHIADSTAFGCSSFQVWLCPIESFFVAPSLLLIPIGGEHGKPELWRNC